MRTNLLLQVMPCLCHSLGRGRVLLTGIDCRRVQPSTGMLLLELRVAMEIRRRCCCRMMQHLSLRQRSSRCCPARNMRTRLLYLHLIQFLRLHNHSMRYSTSIVLPRIILIRRLRPMPLLSLRCLITCFLLHPSHFPIPSTSL